MTQQATVAILQTGTTELGRDFQEVFPVLIEMHHVRIGKERVRYR